MSGGRDRSGPALYRLSLDWHDLQFLGYVCHCYELEWGQHGVNPEYRDAIRRLRAVIDYRIDAEQHSWLGVPVLPPGEFELLPRRPVKGPDGGRRRRLYP